jgi:CHAD domain-containing protein
MNTPEVQETTLDAHQLLLAALESGWKNYRLELKRCQAEFSNEAVHDLRVATRRILALLQLMHSISPRPRLQKMMRIFKEQLDEFDDLRDTQVILAELSEILHELPQLEGFQKYLQYMEEKLLRTLRKKIKKFEISELAKRVRKTHEAIQSEENEQLGTDMLQAVDDAYLLTKIRLGWVDPARPATIHRVRIAFKSFRYMVEILYPLLEGFPVENLKRMNDYQSRMGEIQDTEVFVQTFAEYSEYASVPDHAPIRRYYELNQLHSFWRPAEDQPFPWEKSNENLSDPSQQRR